MQAVGTNNPLYFVAVNGFACWVVLLVAAVHRAVRSDHLALSASATLVAVTLIGWVAVQGLVDHPYRTSTFPAASGTINSESTGTLRLDSETVLVVQSLKAALGAAAYAGRPYLAYDEMAGVVLLLDGRPVGQAWSSTHDPSRSSAVLRAYCVAHDNSWPHGRPILLFNRSIDDRDLAALDACGLSFAADYRQLDVTGANGITAYLPRELTRTRTSHTCAGPGVDHLGLARDGGPQQRLGHRPRLVRPRGWRRSRSDAPRTASRNAASSTASGSCLAIA